MQVEVGAAASAVIEHDRGTVAGLQRRAGNGRHGAGTGAGGEQQQGPAAKVPAVAATATGPAKAQFHARPGVLEQPVAHGASAYAAHMHTQRSEEHTSELQS